ncbi:MAG: ABC transporter permease [Gammaproteobacteria bacterium]|nr:ABC transporter permease [Gammaproteobacteria bacterium]
MDTTLRLAWRNLWRNPRRTLLTMCAIGFGAVLLIFSIGLQLGQYDMMIGSNVRIYQGLLQIQRDGYRADPKMRTSIPDILNLAQKVRLGTGFQQVSARANGFALVSSAKRTYATAVIGVEAANEPRVSTLPGLVKQGHYLSSNHANEVVIGAALAKNLQVSLGDELTLLGAARDGAVAAAVLPITGIFESGNADLDRSMVQIPIETFQETFGMEGHGHSVVIFEEDFKKVTQYQQRIEQALGPHPGLVVLTWDQLQPGLKEMIDLDYSAGWFMYVVLVAIITFSILNTFLMSVLERTREFGIMLALGYKPFNIGRLVMLEALILTLFALMIGIALGVAVNTYFYYHGLTFEGMEEMAKLYNLPAYIKPQMSIKAVLSGPALILIFTLLAALYPAMRIRLLSPVEAMRKI